MAEIKIDKTVLTELKRRAGRKNWEVQGWDAFDNAAVIVRALAQLMGEGEVLNDEPTPAPANETVEAKVAREKADKARVELNHKELLAWCDAILPILQAGAPINFRRGAMVALKLAPEMAKSEKSTAREV